MREKGLFVAVVLIVVSLALFAEDWNRELRDAAKSGDIAGVNNALANGADVNTKDNTDWTPLHWAALGGHKEVCELLIAKGADVNAKDDYGVTPLHWAAYTHSNKDVCKLLVSKGADINAKDKKGATPLRTAILRGNTSVANYFRSVGGSE